jgi:predicted RNA-binding Zn-ribbon protein involved in translation (DUF1610 family)
MELPIKIQHNSKLITDIDIRKPSPGTVADSKMHAVSGAYYSALLTFISGCADRYTDEEGTTVEDRQAVRAITGQMPWASAVYAMVQILLKYDPEMDAVEGVYQCPRCGKKVIAEEREGMDTRDRISSLEVRMHQGKEFEHTVSLSEPTSIINQKTKEPLIEARSMTFRFPTLNDCVRANARHSDRDEVRLSLAIYAEAMTQLNGEPVDDRTRAQYAMMLLENVKDTRAFFNDIRAAIGCYGLETKVRKDCPECGKSWEAQLNTSNFFASGLREG